MRNDCVFCKIANRLIGVNIVYEDDECVAFEDLKKQAPIHFLMIPKKHIESLNGVSREDADLIGGIFLKIKKIAQKAGIAESGYRVVANCNKDAGQEVFHLHFHVLGGREFLWPPG